MINNVQGERGGGGNIKKGSVLTNLPNPTNMSLFLGPLKGKTSEDVFYFPFEAQQYGGVTSLTINLGFLRILYR